MKIFIGCGASKSIPMKYLTDCESLLKELMQENDLVFGASSTGLMGLAYNITLEYGNDVIGIAPEAYKKDLEDLDCKNEIITESVSERTDNLISNSDIVLFLPGGIGTIYEFFSALESKRCNEFNKPIIIYNSYGYFDKLIDFMDGLYGEEFANVNDKNNYIITDDKKYIVDYISNYKMR